MFIMEAMERKLPRRRRSFTPEFKAEIVERGRAGDRTIGQVARDFDLTETAVRALVTQAETDAGDRPGLTTDERAELARLRRENRSPEPPITSAAPALPPRAPPPTLPRPRGSPASARNPMWL
jgi:transposase